MYNLFREWGYDKGSSELFNVLINLAAVLLVILIIDVLGRRVIISAFTYFSNKTVTTFDDFLVRSRFPKYAAHVIPFIIFEQLIPYTFRDYPFLADVFTKLTDIYVVLLCIWILRSFVRSTREYLRTKESFKDKPLDSYAQIVLIFIWFLGIIYIFSELTEQSVVKFLTTLGAASAILLLIFKDTILGFVASIQVSVNDMVRIGDWITLDKYGADGDVFEINLTTVKVRNFDNTVTTIPTYALISDSFKNWRGMQESGGRRIKRAIYLKASSVRYLSVEELTELKKIQSIAPYIDHRQRDIDKYNTQQGFDKSLLVNGRNQTNLGIFRKYCDLYLQQHPAVNKELMMMTRHLAPTPYGIPLEIYVFSSDKRWENYERIMADIFEHLLAAVPYFKLEVFEVPSGGDIQNLQLPSSTSS